MRNPPERLERTFGVDDPSFDIEQIHVARLYNGETKKALLFLLTPLFLITSSFTPRPYSWMISLAVLLGIHADAVIIALTSGRSYRIKPCNRAMFVRDSDSCLVVFWISNASSLPAAPLGGY